MTKKAVVAEATKPEVVEESKEVATTQPSHIPAVVEEEYLDKESEVLVSMIKIPSLYLCQKSTKVVEAKKAEIGDLVENVQSSIICKFDKPFYFFPLKLRNVITTYEVKGSRKEFVSRVPRTRANEKQEWDEVKDGKTFRHLPETQLFLIAESDLQDGNICMPMCFTFRGASMPKGGKAIYNAKIMLDDMNMPFYSFKFAMTNERGEDKQGNSFQAALVQNTREKVTADQKAKCEKWLKTINSISVDLVEEDDVQDGTEPAGPSAVKQQF